MSRLNRDRRPRVCGVTNKFFERLNVKLLNFNETYLHKVMRVLDDAGPEAAGSRYKAKSRLTNFGERSEPAPDRGGKLQSAGGGTK